MRRATGFASANEADSHNAKATKAMAMGLGTSISRRKIDTMGSIRAINAARLASMMDIMTNNPKSSPVGRLAKA